MAVVHLVFLRNAKSYFCICGFIPKHWGFPMYACSKIILLSENEKINAHSAFASVLLIHIGNTLFYFWIRQIKIMKALN